MSIPSEYRGFLIRYDYDGDCWAAVPNSYDGEPGAVLYVPKWAELQTDIDAWFEEQPDAF